MSHGTLIDATLIAAPSSTKNEKHERDPDMRQTRKGNQWHFVRFAHSATRNLGHADVLRRLRLPAA